VLPFLAGRRIVALTGAGCSTESGIPDYRALASLEEAGLLAGVITQNVDRLHHRAGSRRVVELHGALSEVRCLRCGDAEERDGLQQRQRGSAPSRPFLSTLAAGGQPAAITLP
jgi:NAD+-dependent protein deacetylase sirtuin 4